MAFLCGVVVGALGTLLMTPESGADIRTRLRRGAKTAQDELTDAAAETAEALGALSKDARQTIRQTASRLGAALQATKEAIKQETTKGPAP